MGCSDAEKSGGSSEVRVPSLGPGSRGFDSHPPDQTFLFTFKTHRYIVINDTKRGD